MDPNMKIFDFKRIILSKTGSKPFFLKFNMCNNLPVKSLLEKDAEYNKYLQDKMILSGNFELDNQIKEKVINDKIEIY